MISFVHLSMLQLDKLDVVHIFWVKNSFSGLIPCLELNLMCMLHMLWMSSVLPLRYS